MASIATNVQLRCRRGVLHRRLPEQLCRQPNSSPPGRTENGVLKRVIGYYEAWMINSNCRHTEPGDLPLDVIIHFNYAFAFLTPGTYDIVPMEQSIPVSLFKRTTDLKKIKPGLQVWLSLGGWTFNDNGTVTQPLLGEIARDANKRALFADKALLSWKSTHLTVSILIGSIQELLIAADPLTTSTILCCS